MADRYESITSKTISGGDLNSIIPVEEKIIIKDNKAHPVKRSEPKEIEPLIDDLSRDTDKFMYATKSEVDLNTPNNLDGHLHVFSLDSFQTLRQVTDEALNRGIDTIAITDHNTPFGINNVMKAQKLPNTKVITSYNNVNIINGTEVTCYVNFGGNQPEMKIHMLCYGFNRGNNSFMKLLESKYQDYKECTYHFVYALSEINPKYKTTIKSLKAFTKKISMQTPGFNNDLNKDQIAQYYYETKGIPTEETARDLATIRFQREPAIRPTLDSVVRTVHEAGGYCAFAHPLRNLYRYMQKNHLDMSKKLEFCTTVIDTMLDAGVDGVQLCENAVPGSFEAAINDHFKDAFLTVYGTDKHHPGGSKMVGAFKGEELPPCNFKKRMVELDNAKSKGLLTPRLKAVKSINWVRTDIDMNKFKTVVNEPIQKVEKKDEKMQEANKTQPKLKTNVKYKFPSKYKNPNRYKDNELKNIDVNEVLKEQDDDFNQ